MRRMTRLAAGLLAAGVAASAVAQDAFDACEVFTLEEAKKVLGAGAQPEPANPKVKRPRVVPSCSYTIAKDGKTIAATASFRSGRAEADLQRAFEEDRLRFQSKPVLIEGGSGYWSAKQGQMHLLKGRHWVSAAVGGAKPGERDAEMSRRLAEILVKKL